MSRVMILMLMVCSFAWAQAEDITQLIEEDNGGTPLPAQTEDSKQIVEENGGGTPAEDWKLVVEDNNGVVSSIYWENQGIRKAAMDTRLFRIAREDPSLIKSSPTVKHAILVIPFDSEGFPRGDVVVLKPGEAAKYPEKPLLGQEPEEISPHPEGFFFARVIGTKVTIEFYYLKDGKTEKFPIDIKVSELGRLHKLQFTDREAVIISSGKRLSFLPGQKKVNSSLILNDLAEGNLKIIEHDFGARDLTKEASHGTLDPDVTEGERVQEIADAFQHKQSQRNVLLWGEPGNNVRGIIHFFIQKMADGELPYFKGWKVYQLNWVSLNTKGLVDKGIDRTKTLLDAASGKKVILYVPNFENLIGLGVDNHSTGSKGDVSSVFQTYIEAGKIFVIASTSSNYIGTVQGKGDLYQQFTAIQVGEPLGDLLIAKLRAKADTKFAQTGVKFSDESLDKILDLTNRYIPDKRQPGKSYDAINALVAKHSAKKIDDTGQPPIVDITEEYISAYVATVSRIPTVSSDLSKALREFTLTEKYYKGMAPLVGQEAALESVKGALLQIAMARKKTDAIGGEVGLTALLMAGPSGTGKSFTPEVLAKALKKNGIDLPYQEPIQGSTLVDGEQAVRTLIGSAPSYIGYQRDGGLLYQKVRDFPQSILVLEEFDKMHEDVDKVIYDFLDTGKVINASGLVARFSRGLVFLTANFGCEGSGGVTIRNAMGKKPEDLCDYIDRWDRHHLFKDDPHLHRKDPLVADWDEDALQYNLFNCLKTEKLLNTQILGRIGKSNLVIFHHFTKEHLRSIGNHLLGGNVELYQETHKASIEYGKKFKDWLLDTSWGEDGMNSFNFGARAIIDAIKAEVDRPLLEFAALQGDDHKGKTWRVVLNSTGDGVKVEPIEPEPKEEPPVEMEPKEEPPVEDNPKVEPFVEEKPKAEPPAEKERKGGPFEIGPKVEVE